MSSDNMDRPVDEFDDQYDDIGYNAAAQPKPDKGQRRLDRDWETTI